MTYQLTSETLAADAQPIVRQVDGATIPHDPRNADYQSFSAWLAASGIPDPAPAPPPSPVISKLAFLSLFTPAELLAIATAAQSSPAINVWLITAQAYDAINLADPVTKAGLNALVAAGLLAGARETAILANQPP